MTIRRRARFAVAESECEMFAWGDGGGAATQRAVRALTSAKPRASTRGG